MSLCHAANLLITTTSGSCTWCYSITETRTLILPNIFSAPRHKLNWEQMLLASSCTPCFDGSGHTSIASPTQGHWFKYIDPCIRLQRALFPLVRILGRLNEVLHKNGSPAWFPLLHVKTFFQLFSFLHQSPDLDSMTYYHPCLQGPQSDGVHKKKPTVFMGHLESVSISDYICPAIF